MANKFNTGPKATKGSHNQRSKMIHSWFLELEDFDQHQDQKQTKQVLKADLGLNKLNNFVGFLNQSRNVE